MLEADARAVVVLALQAQPDAAKTTASQRSAYLGTHYSAVKPALRTTAATANQAMLTRES
jgi:hypothetical protein